MPSPADKAQVQAKLEWFLQGAAPSLSRAKTHGGRRVHYPTKQEEEEARRILRQHQAAAASAQVDEIILNEYARLKQAPIRAAPDVLVSPSLAKLLSGR